ncbi:hypothetical protein [Aliikangiella maris]|uniref:DUF1240 domain-containing protein n=1 Tax=Aliikangiella maris TaxID=3162458 RepID=A0ABV3MRT4_9GAMM
MTTQKTQYVEVPTDLKTKLLAISVVFSMLFLAIFGVSSSFYDLVDGFERLNRGSYYVEVSTWDLPILVSLPCLLSTIYIALALLFNRVTEKGRRVALRIMIFFCIGFLIVRLFYGFWVINYVENKGYHFCWYYSNVSMMTPNVYMNQPDLCYPVNPKSDILPWFDEQEAKGVVLTPDRVKAQADKISEAYEAQFR